MHAGVGWPDGRGRIEAKDGLSILQHAVLRPERDGEARNDASGEDTGEAGHGSARSANCGIESLGMGRFVPWMSWMILIF